MIQTDDKGERRFFHWRESAAARSLMELPETAEILESLASYDIVYLSAITLSLYSEAGRARLFAGIKRAREAERDSLSTPIFARAGGPISTSREPCSSRRSRPRTSCWPRPRICCRYIPAKAMTRFWRVIPGAEVVLKLSEPASIVRLDGVSHPVKAEPVRRPSSTPPRPATVLLPPMSPRGWRAPTPSRLLAPGIVWPALSYAVPARSSACGDATRINEPFARHRHDRSIAGRKKSPPSSGPRPSSRC